MTVFEKMTGDTPEVVAYHLMQAILTSDRRAGRATREEILDTYAECLIAARGERLSMTKPKALAWPPEAPSRLDPPARLDPPTRLEHASGRQPGSLRLNSQ